MDDRHEHNTTRRRMVLGLAGATLVRLGFARPSGAEPKARYRCCDPSGSCFSNLFTRQDAKQAEANGFTCSREPHDERPTE